MGSLRRLRDFASFINVWKRSAANTNNRGDKGSPCLTPLLQWNLFPGTPLRKTEEVPELNIINTHCSQTTPKPKNRLMLNFIKGLFKIQFQNDYFLFLNDDRDANTQKAMLNNKPYWFLCTKIWINYHLVPIIQELCDDLDRDIKRWNWPKVWCPRRAIHLWNQCNIRTINAL